MIRKLTIVLLLLTVVALMGVPGALATPTIKNNFTTLYGVGGTRIDSCDTCHIPGQTPSLSTLNPYGKDLFNDSAYATNVTQSMINVEPKDSDNDGFTNIVEIHNLTFPGNASDFPPKITSFAPPSPVTSTGTPATVMFNVTINQVVDNATWALDGTVTKTEHNVNASNDTLTTNTVGTHTVTFTAQRTGDGSAMQNWTWNVSAPITLKSITVSPSTANLTVNGTQMFTATALDQNNTPMAGINISWTSSNMTVGTVSPSSATTNMNGTATTTFTALAPGTAMVNATSGNVSGTATVTVVTVPTFNISGFKLNSATGSGIPGWNITIKNAMMQKSMLTGANGSYMFTDLANGTYNVSEEMKPGFTPVGATLQGVTINGSDVANVNFTNNPISAINRTFVADLTGGEEVPPVVTLARGNATFNLSDDGTVLHFKITVANITNATLSHIHLAPIGVNGSIVVNLFTGPTKTGRFDGVLAEGNITQADLTGPLAGQPLSALLDNMTNGNTYVNVHTTQHPAGEIRGQIRVAPAPNARFSISGFKINNATDSGIQDWNITLSNGTTNALIDSKPTDANGFYQFIVLANGSYNVSEEMKSGFTPVGATLQSVTIAGQDAKNVNFTNTPAVVPVPAFNISGFKINDTNGNGVWDPGEMGIENWNINLLNATTGTQITNTSTAASGFYQFMNITPGSYNVTEGMKAGFTSTNATSHMITVENMDVMNVNFTNQPVAPSAIVTSFVLTPNLNTTLNGMPISIAITALNGNVSQTLFNGMADINITANNVSAVSSPMNVSFTNGNATIQVTSSVAQFVTVTATSATAANTSITGSTQVMFADKIFSLSKGWNLISIPNFAEPSSVSQLLKNVQNNGVVGFDSATGNFTTPTDLEPLFGYWINVTADNQSIGFIASTTIPSMPPTRKLSEGWNLIGVSASRSDPDTLSAGELFVDLKRGLDYTQWLYTRLVSFEQPASPVTFVAGTDLSDLTALKQGHGYWLFIKDLSSINTNNLPWAGKQW